MTATMRHQMDNLRRSAAHQGWDMVVNTALLNKLLLAAEVAESELAYRGLDYNDPAFDAHVAAHTDTLDAYRKATR